MTTTDRGDGAGVLTRDSKLGNIAGGLVSALGLALVDWLGGLDFSDFPSAIATLAPPAVGLIIGLITSKMAKRR